MNKVLIIGPNYFNFLSATESAFGRLGWSTVVDSYDNPIHPYTKMMKVRYKISRNRKLLQQKSRQTYNTHILEVFSKVKPNMVFIMNGDILEAHTLDMFRESAKVALWLFDSRERLKQSIGHVDHVDAMFCYDKCDVEQYLKEGKQAYFLPQACDTDTYRPLSLQKDIDILFIGNLLFSPKRQAVCKAVINNFHDNNIQIYGLYKPWYKGILKWAFREHRTIYRNCNVSPEQANILYNRARIVLNIHQEQQKNGANPRVFEICGSGAYQLCDGNDFIDNLFEEGEIGIWHSVDELVRMIGEKLKSDNRSQMELAYKKVIDNHTFDVRMRTVINITVK